MNHRVLGIEVTEHEVVQITKEITCSLCLRQQGKGKYAVSMADAMGKTYYAHVNCFGNHYKKTGDKFNPSKKTRVQNKQVKEAFKDYYCSYCPKVISKGNEYVKDKKNLYHPDCLKRKRAFFDRRKQSLR